MARRATWQDYAGLIVLTAVFVASIWPIVHSGSIPAFQQDWSWPLSRSLALRWLHAFVGMWDDRSLGQPNLLPWQTYAVIAQVALVLAFGAAYGLAAWILLLELTAAGAFIAMLRTLGVTSRASLYVGALLYAAGPVFFTRLQAGHLAYLFAYALLPLVVLLAYRLAERPRASLVLALGLSFGLACSQIQFLLIAPLAVAALLVCVPMLRRRWRELLAAGGIGIAVQLQALLPLAFSAAASIYEQQRALVSWEYNLSAHPERAAIMLGYFTHYYEQHASVWTPVALCLLTLSAFVAAFASRHRLAGFALSLWLLGWLVTAGLYGPLSIPLTWLFAHVGVAGAFRDLNYFAALTSLGISLAVALALDSVTILALAYVPLVVLVALPTAMGAGLAPLLLPRQWIADTLVDELAIHEQGPGRVLWLPAEEPIGPMRGRTAGRDIATYAPPGNASVHLVPENRALTYALSTLQEGRPQWQLFVRMGVRYFVERSYLRADSAAALAIRPDRTRRVLASLTLVRRSPYSDVYELMTRAQTEYDATAAPSIMLFSELKERVVAIASGAPRVFVQTSVESPDPDRGWIPSSIGVQRAPWLADSIYPFAWTASSQEGVLRIPRRVRCIVVAARGSWRRYGIGNGSGGETLLQPHGIAAIAEMPCDARVAPAASGALFVVASGYDAGWRAVARGRLVAPSLADGWMMAWPVDEAASRRVYLPAIAQGIGVLLGALVIAIAALRVKLR